MIRTIILTVLLGIVLSVLSACGGLNGNPDDFLPTATIPVSIPPRSITQVTLPLHEVWRKDIHRLGQNGGAIFPSSDIFLPLLDKLYVVDVNPINADSRPLQILALDQATGKQLWTTNQMWYGGYNFTATPDELVVAEDNGIVAYDSITGSVKWVSDQPRPNHQRYYLSYNAPTLSLIIWQGPQFSYTTIDLQSGKVGDQHIADAPWGLVKIDSQYRYLWMSKDTLQLENVSTNQSEQLTSLPQRPGTPLRSGNIIVIPYVYTIHSVLNSIIVLDIATRQKLWDCQECFASDVAIDGNELYAISRDGMLVGYDLGTGKSLGTVDFSGGSKIDPGTTLYGISALNGRVFLYFGDVQQIIALGP